MITTNYDFDGFTDRRNSPLDEDPAIDTILTILSEFGCANKPLAARLIEAVRKADAMSASK